MNRTVAEKMGITAAHKLLINDGPVESVTAIELPTSHDVVAKSEKSYDHTIWFVVTQKQMDEGFDLHKQTIASTGKLWIAWPKGGRLGTDLNIKEVIRIGYDHGLVESTNLRIDDVWTALKFTYPKPGKSYHNSYGTLK